MERIISFLLGMEELEKFRSYLQDRYPNQYRLDESNLKIYDSAGEKVATYSPLGLAYHEGVPEIIPTDPRLEAILAEFMAHQKQET